MPPKRKGLSYKHVPKKRRTQEQVEQNREETRQRMEHLRAARTVLSREVMRIASKVAFNDNAPQHNCGSLSETCNLCKAKHFNEERPPDKHFTQCCSKGKVELEPIKTSELIQKLLEGQHEHSTNFFKNIRQINSSLAFASLGAQIKSPPGSGPYCFRVNGEIYHCTGALHPENEDNRKFAQIYILDPNEAAKQRMRIADNSGVKPELMNELSLFMARNNPFAEAYKMLYEVEQEAICDAEARGVPQKIVIMEIVRDRRDDQRRYNQPISNEVAIVFANTEGEPPLERDLLVHCRTPNNRNSTKRISILDPNLEPMVYPIFFPYGDQSWTHTLPLTYNSSIVRRSHSENRRERISQMQYYGYRLSIRDEFNPFLSAGRLTQQYIVDAYVKTEANRLNYQRFHQKQLRVEKYTGLMDHIHSEAAAQGLQAGTAVILASSFSGSPRNMAQNYQDAMAIVRKYGKPDLFITMTCNPKWKEIVQNLHTGQSVENRPDLVARVFAIKLKALLEDISKKHVLGKPTAKIHVIEFQKRGLPHAHILLILSAEDKLKDSESIDQFISAEIPDINEHPNLHAIITKHMIHGPCGIHNLNSPCMVDGKCSKQFPKQFQEETLANVNGYPRYKRRNMGSIIVNNKEIDNSWVVSYNSYLSLKYNCHINMESCASVKSVKYLFKYVYKGHDCANVVMQEKRTLEHDEIKKFLDSRYVSPPEAAWRLFDNKMHDQSHAIIRLQVHLPNEQSVYFTEDNMEERLKRASTKDTTLTGWFKLNREDPAVRDILYHDIPIYYVWDKSSCKWKPRQRGADIIIGRMYSVSLASDVERFCLRLLLLHIPGAISFEDLRTVDGIQYLTFKEAAKKRGFLEDDQIWEQTLQEAASQAMPRQLRELFAHLCVLAVPPNISELFEKYKNQMGEDISRHEGHDDECSHCINFILREIQEVLTANGKSCSDFGLPNPPENIPAMPSMFFDAFLEYERATEMIDSLNDCQRQVFDEIVAAMKNNSLSQRCFFLDGPGGSGKTYLYTTFLHHVRGNRDIALPVASTGIAANLMEGGRTYHSQFKLPVPLLDNSISRMRMTSEDAEQIRTAKLLIWDESTMATIDAIRCVDLLLKEIMKNEKPFGGKTIILGGDFRQTLPVVPHGNREAIVQSCIKYNALWRRFKILKLTNNVRSVDLEFSDFLLQLGNGELTNQYGLLEDIIEIPEHMVCNESIVKEIFGVKLEAANAYEYAKKAILCPKNIDADQINEECLNLLDGSTTTYFSSDSIDDANDEDIANYPIEFLNEQTPSGMPLHKLNLKEGAIIMLLRNLNTKRGLCNGTRFVVKKILKYLIIAEALTGNAKGQPIYIPRVNLAPTNTDLPFVLRRRQFPVKLAFAMTINKSQGQTLDKVGVFLPEPVFSHGQLYVALSRARRSADVRVKIVDGKDQGKLLLGSDSVFTKNVVYKEVFDM